MSVLVIGRTGQLAQALARHRWPAGMAVACRGRDTLDIAAPDGAGAVAEAIAATGARVVVNAAAYTAVDRAEREPDAAFALNRDGAARVAEACARARVPLIHVSTDSVFDGTRQGAYREDDPVSPLGVYGTSKEAGERAVRERVAAHVILRTSWVFGPDGHNFVKLMLRLGDGKEELRVVADQVGRPTSADDLAAAIAHVAARCAGERPSPATHASPWGTFHVAGDDAMTRIAQARDIFAAAAQRGRKAPRLVPMTMRDWALAASADAPPAPRPANAVLDCAAFAHRFGGPARPWPAALERCLDALLPVAATGDAR